MYVLAVNPSPPNPMGSISDDWVQDGFVDPLDCMMSIVLQSDLGEKGRQVVFVENSMSKDSALYPVGLLYLISFEHYVDIAVECRYRRS